MMRGGIGVLLAGIRSGVYDRDHSIPGIRSTALPEHYQVALCTSYQESPETSHLKTVSNWSRFIYFVPLRQQFRRYFYCPLALGVFNGRIFGIYIWRYLWCRICLTQLAVDSSRAKGNKRDLQDRIVPQADTTTSPCHSESSEVSLITQLCCQLSHSHPINWGVFNFKVSTTCTLSYPTILG